MLILWTQGNGEFLIYQSQPLDDCCSSALWSPASQELEAVLQTNGTSGDCHEMQSPFGDSECCHRDRNEVSTCDEDETVSDVYPQVRMNMLSVKKFGYNSIFTSPKNYSKT